MKAGARSEGKAFLGFGILYANRFFRTRKTKVAVVVFLSVVALFKTVDMYAEVQYERYLLANNLAKPNSWLGWKEYMTPCSSNEGCWFGRYVHYDSGLSSHGTIPCVEEVESRGWFKRKRFLDMNGKPITESKLFKPGGTL